MVIMIMITGPSDEMTSPPVSLCLVLPFISFTKLMPAGFTEEVFTVSEKERVSSLVRKFRSKACSRGLVVSAVNSSTCKAASLEIGRASLSAMSLMTLGSREI